MRYELYNVKIYIYASKFLKKMVFFNFLDKGPFTRCLNKTILYVYLSSIGKVA